MQHWMNFLFLDYLLTYAEKGQNSLEEKKILDTELSRDWRVMLILFATTKEINIVANSCKA